MPAMIQPDALKQPIPWPWSPGSGIDVWEMFRACAAGDVRTVEQLLAKDPSLVRSHYEYRTPLAFAVRENRPEVARLLLERGADALALGDMVELARDRGLVEMERLLEDWFANRYGASPRGESVAAAIRKRKIGEVRRLLDDSPELLHAGDGRSSQPIHWAVMTRQLDVIDELLARGADINARRQDGARPIHLANGDYHYRGWRDVPKYVRTTPNAVYAHLVARGADVDLGMAAATGDIRRVRALIDGDPSLVNRVSEYNSYYIGCGAPIKNAAAGGHMEIVKLLLERGADPNLPEEGIAPRGHALHSAVFNGHHAIAKLLLEHGADPDAEVESSADVVGIAIMRGDLRMIELLASHGATWVIGMRMGRGLTYRKITATGIRRSVRILALYGDVDAATPFLAANPELADDREALENAAGGGHEAFVRLLLRHRPDVARRVKVSKPRAMAELLFAHGMDPNRPSWLHITPLHEFARHGDVRSAKLYLDHGADVNAREEESRSTPLAWAARFGQMAMVKLLLRRGATPAHPDDPPWATPLAWAERRGHDRIAQQLRQALREG